MHGVFTQTYTWKANTQLASYMCVMWYIYREACAVTSSSRNTSDINRTHQYYATTMLL